MKKLLCALALAIGIPLLVAAPAVAEPVTDCKTVTANLVRPDSGTVGNWATDTFHRVVKVCHAVETAKAVEVQSWTYTAVGTDDGTFKTTGTTSFTGAAMKDGVTGKFSGHFSMTFEAPKDWGLYAGTPADGSKYSTSDWLAHMWTDGFKPGKFVWGWLYATCGGRKPGETLINASTGNKGNITGKHPCASPSTSVSASRSTGPAATPTALPSSGAPSLPVTGPNATIYGLGAAGLLASGVVLFVVARRRRVRFEA